MSRTIKEMYRPFERTALREVEVSESAEVVRRGGLEQTGG